MIVNLRKFTSARKTSRKTGLRKINVQETRSRFVNVLKAGRFDTRSPHKEKNATYQFAHSGNVLFAGVLQEPRNVQFLPGFSHRFPVWFWTCKHLIRLLKTETNCVFGIKTKRHISVDMITFLAFYSLEKFACFLAIPGQNMFFANIKRKEKGCVLHCTTESVQQRTNLTLAAPHWQSGQHIGTLAFCVNALPMDVKQTLVISALLIGESFIAFSDRLSTPPFLGHICS